MKEVTLSPLKVFPLDDAELSALHSHLLDVLPLGAKVMGYVGAGVLVQVQPSGDFRVVCGENAIIDATVTS